MKAYQKMNNGEGQRFLASAISDVIIHSKLICNFNESYTSLKLCNRCETLFEHLKKWFHIDYKYILKNR